MQVALGHPRLLLPIRAHLRAPQMRLVDLHILARRLAPLEYLVVLRGEVVLGGFYWGEVTVRLRLRTILLLDLLVILRRRHVNRLACVALVVVVHHLPIYDNPGPLNEDLNLLLQLAVQLHDLLFFLCEH